MSLTPEQQQVMDDITRQMNGGDNMATDGTSVKGVGYVRDNDIEAILTDIASDGILMYNKAYKELKGKFREAGLSNKVLEVDEDTGYYNKSAWSKDGAEASVEVTYRVPMYTNSRGKEVRGKKLELSA